MASVQQEGHLSNQEFQNVQSFSKSSYKLLETFTALQHPALTMEQKETCLLDKSNVDSQLVSEQLPATLNRGRHSATSAGAKKETNSLLAYLLQVAKQKASYPITEEGEAIKNMMENAADNFCEYLRANFRLFHECRLLKTGSTYEGVKIGKPDEFDFMIEVPSLASSNAVVFRQGLCSNSLGRIIYEVCDKGLFSDIFEFEAAHFTVKGPVEQEAFMKVIFAKLLHAIETKFIEFLPAGWEFMGISGNVTMNADMFGMSGISAPARMALTPRFVWHGKTFPSLKVTVDFAFAIPVVKPACVYSPAPLKKDVDGSSEETWLPIPELEKCDISGSTSTRGSNTEPTFVASEDNELRKPLLIRDDAKRDSRSNRALDQPESQPVHLAQEEDLVSTRPVPDVFHLLLADFIWCRASFSIQEQEIMAEFNLSDGQKICMRLVKYLRDAFIPQDYDDKTFDLKPSIPTYWLKTIMYYMYAKYRNDEMAWKADHLNDRVLEVFETLLECLQQSSLYSFFVPSYNLLSMKQPGELGALTDGVRSLLQLFYSCDRGEVTLGDMEAYECRQIGENEKVLYENRRSTLMEMLLTHAIYGTDDDDEELEHIQCFANHYLDGVAGHTVLITGRGQDILFFEDGKSVDIGIKETLAILDEHCEAYEIECAEND